MGNMILIINGPNLNLLGRREPQIYGTECFDSCLARLRKDFPDVEIDYLQSNAEGAIIDAIQEYGFLPHCQGIIINPGAYSHYSLAIADAIGAVPVPVVEVHISNIHAREEYRHKSVTGAKCKGIIAGLGLEGYSLALQYLAKS